MGGFPGTFPTMGPGNTVEGFPHGGWGGRGRFRTTFLFGNGGVNWPFYYPNYYPYAPNPQYVCEWEEKPPKEDTKMVCTPKPNAYPVVNYPVTYGPPNWGWW